VPKKKSTAEMQAELAAILAVDVPEGGPVYANCDEVRKVINAFLTSSGINQTQWTPATR
jgi:hypothetical protein